MSPTSFLALCAVVCLSLLVGTNAIPATGAVRRLGEGGSTTSGGSSATDNNGNSDGGTTSTTSDNNGNSDSTDSGSSNTDSTDSGSSNTDSTDSGSSNTDSTDSGTSSTDSNGGSSGNTNGQGSTDGYNPNASGGAVGALCSSDSDCSSDSCGDQDGQSQRMCECQKNSDCPGQLCCDLHGLGKVDKCTVETSRCSGVLEDIGRAGDDIGHIFSSACKLLGDVEKAVGELATCATAFTSGGTDVEDDVNCACDIVKNIDSVSNNMDNSKVGNAVNGLCGAVSDVEDAISDGNQLTSCVDGTKSCLGEVMSYGANKFFNCGR